jgi:hypothetical protein
MSAWPISNASPVVSIAQRPTCFNHCRAMVLWSPTWRSDASRLSNEGVQAMAKKSKRKLPDLHGVLGKMNEADALLQCVLRSLQQRSSPIANGVTVFLYDEITVLKKAAKAYSKVYKQIDRYALEVA